MVGKSDEKWGSGSTQSDDRMVFWNREEPDMSGLIEWIAYYYLFLSIRKMHYWINITKIICDQSGSGKKKSDEN